MRKITGRSSVEDLCGDLLQDESNSSGSWCMEAVWPENTPEAAEYMADSAAAGVPITVSGGLTGVTAGALPIGGAVVSTSAMKGLSLTDGGLLRSGAGVTIAEIREFLAAAAPGRFYPPDPTEETASVGGTVATDASGSDSYLYGSTRKWVRKLDMVLPGGRTLLLERGEYGFGDDGICSHPELGRLELPALFREQPPKNAAGYHVRQGMDLLDLFIGSEGTLGLITGVWLETAPVPPGEMDLAVFPADWGAFWDIYRSFTADDLPLRIRAVEMMDDRCLRFMALHPGDHPSPPEGAAAALMLRIEVDDEDGLYDALGFVGETLEGTGIDPDSVWGGFEPTERKKIRDLRHALPESVNREVTCARLSCPGIHKLGSDGAVPPVSLESYFDRVRGILDGMALNSLVFGHAGQGHLHANIIPSDMEELIRGEGAMREVAALSVEMGGTISAEHGLGRLKAGFLPLMYSPEELQGMEALRRSIDPNRLIMPSLHMNGTG